METSHNKWRIDSIRSILFFNKKIDFKKNEWSQLVTGIQQLQAINMAQPENQYIEMTHLDNNKQLNLIHVEDKNVIVLHLIFNDKNKYFDFNEISKEVDNFYVLLNKLNPEINENVIRIGNILELSIPNNDESNWCSQIKNNFSYLSGLSDGLEDINLKMNKPAMNENIKINRVIRIANDKKISINMNKATDKPTANIEKTIAINIDVNTDEIHKYPFNLINFSKYLENYLKEIVNNGGGYVNN